MSGIGGHMISTAVGTLVGWNMAYDKDNQYALKLVQDAARLSKQEFTKIHPNQARFYDKLCEIIENNKQFNTDHLKLQTRVNEIENVNDTLKQDLKASNLKHTKKALAFNNLVTHITTISSRISQFCLQFKGLQEYTVERVSSLTKTQINSLMIDIMKFVVFSGCESIGFSANMHDLSTLDSIVMLIDIIERDMNTNKVVFSVAK